MISRCWFYQCYWKKIANVLADIPKVWTHWDFTTPNIFPNGVIDLEDHHSNYLWYDVFALLTHIYWFPQYQDAEHIRRFSFTKDQVIRWLNALSTEIDYLDDNIFAWLFLYRWTRAIQNMEDDPKLQAFRHKEYEKIWKLFLEWESVKRVCLRQL